MAVALNTNEFDDYYAHYINLAHTGNCIKGLEKNLSTVSNFFEAIAIDKQHFAYATGKWTINALLLHIIDVERIFNYRALRIARGDKTPLAGFNHNNYINCIDTTGLNLPQLITEYKAQRLATISLYKSFNVETLLNIGTASNAPFSVRAIGYIMQGHEMHHINVIKAKYL